MITNFTHLSKNENMYEKMLFVENMLCDGTSKQDYVRALAEMRGVLDIMMKDWVRKAGLTESEILEDMSLKFNETRNRVDLYGRIYSLEKHGAISRDTADALHYIRQAGNDAVHYSQEIMNMTKESAYRKAVMVYEKLYKTSYEYSAYSPAHSSAAQTAGVDTAFNSDTFAYKPGRNELAKDMFNTLWPASLTIFFIIFVALLFFFGFYLCAEEDYRGIIFLFPCGIGMIVFGASMNKFGSQTKGIAYSMSDPEAEAYCGMRKKDKKAFVWYKLVKLYAPRANTPQMEMQYRGLLSKYMDQNQQQQFMEQQQQFMNDQQFTNQQQLFMNQQQQFMDQQQQFMDRQFMDQQEHFNAFSDPLNSTEGSSIFNDSLNMNSGLDFGNTLDSGLDFGSGFGGGFDNFGL